MGNGPEKTLFFFPTGQQECEIVSTSLIIREPQTTTWIKYHVKKTRDKNEGEDVDSYN